MGWDNNAVIYQVSKVVDCIYEVLVSTNDTYVVGYFYGSLIVNTKDSGMSDREAEIYKHVTYKYYFTTSIRCRGIFGLCRRQRNYLKLFRSKAYRSVHEIDNEAEHVVAVIILSAPRRIGERYEFT